MTKTEIETRVLSGLHITGLDVASVIDGTVVMTHEWGTNDAPSVRDAVEHAALALLQATAVEAVCIVYLRASDYTLITSAIPPDLDPADAESENTDLFLWLTR